MNRDSLKRTVLVLSNPMDLHTDAVMYFLDQLRPEDVSIVRRHTSEVEEHDVMMDEESSNLNSDFM